MKTIRFSTEAHLDIEEIASYIFDLNPVAAGKLLDALDKTCELLAERPLMGRLRPTLAENLRSFPIGNYLIFYAPAADGIDVVRVVYGWVICPACLATDSFSASTAEISHRFARFQNRFPVTVRRGFA